MNNSFNIAGSLTYTTNINIENFNQGLRNIDKKSSNLADSMKVAIGNIIADLARIATESLKEIAKAGVEYNAQIEKYQTALTTLTGSAEEANKIIEQIKKDAASTPFDVNGLVQANQLLISAGVSSDKAREDILALGNAISATGGGNEELQRMAVNLQQIKNVGKASALDIKQFAYAGIDVYGLLADSMGITREEASQLDVTYEDLTKALRKAAEDGGKYAGAMEAQSRTFNGQVSNLKDNLDQLIGNAMTPLFNLLRDDILPIVNELIQGEGDVNELLTNLSDKLIEFVGNTLAKLLDMLPQLVDLGINIVISLIEGIAKQLPTLVPKIADVIVKITQTITEHLPEIIQAGTDILSALIEGLTNAQDDLIQKAPELITDFVDGLTNPDADSKLQSSGSSLMKSIIKGIGHTLVDLLILPHRIAEQFGERFKNSIQGVNWGEFGKWIVEGVWNGIVKKREKFFSDVADFFKGLVKKAKKALGIASPSKLFAQEVGQFIPAGVAVGIEANTDSVDKAIDELNDEMLNKMTQAVNIETGKMNYSGTNGTVSQMMSAFGTVSVPIENKLYLDGDVVYDNQQTVSAKKNLQTQFGGGYSVSS